MENYNYPGFDKLEKDSPLKLSLPLCDILKSFLGERDFPYIGAAFYPLELTELILYYLEYHRGIKEGLDTFSQKYLNEDSLCRIDDLIKLWGTEKFNQMISDLQNLAKI